jgi:hypothetical protein
VNNYSQSVFRILIHKIISWFMERLGFNDFNIKNGENRENALTEMLWIFNCIKLKIHRMWKSEITKWHHIVYGERRIYYWIDPFKSKAVGILGKCEISKRWDKWMYLRMTYWDGIQVLKWATNMLLIWQRGIHIVCTE